MATHSSILAWKILWTEEPGRLQSMGLLRVVGFLNSRSKTIKLGKWWLVIVKYILPIFISIIWVGGLIDVLKTQTFDQSVFMIIVAVILVVATIVFTVIPAKNPDWDDVEERV